jgi:hypothetical protein
MDQTGVVATDNIITGGTIANVAAGAITIQSAQRNSISGVRITGHATSVASTPAILLQNSAYASPAAVPTTTSATSRSVNPGTPANYTHGVKFDATSVAVSRNRFESCFFGAPGHGHSHGRYHQHRVGVDTNLINEGDYVGSKAFAAHATNAPVHDL